MPLGVKANPGTGPRIPPRDEDQWWVFHPIPPEKSASGIPTKGSIAVLQAPGFTLETRSAPLFPPRQPCFRIWEDYPILKSYLIVSRT
jgi:hypothetical protein